MLYSLECFFDAFVFRDLEGGRSVSLVAFLSLIAIACEAARSVEQTTQPFSASRPLLGERIENDLPNSQLAAKFCFSQDFTRNGITHETFFCVHSRFWRTSRASSMPSAKRARDLARRACACFCSSASSRCFALRRPDLLACQHWVSLSLLGVDFADF